MEFITWATLLTYLNTSVPSILDVGGSKGVKIGFDPNFRKLFLVIPIDSEVRLLPKPYAELNITVITFFDRNYLEVSTSNPTFFQAFYRFSEIIAEVFEANDVTALEAFNSAIHVWDKLISFKKILSDEQQIGLMGELLFLKALLHRSGVGAVYSWVGRNSPSPDRHDFRIQNYDIEIKTTKGPNRFHIIHGLDQLVPSVGHDLFIYSIKLEDAGIGEGTSLFDSVVDIRSMLNDFPDEKSVFDKKLAAAGYKDDDAFFYTNRIRLSDKPRLILVDDTCPRITKKIINNYLPKDVGLRISNVFYTIDVEELGYEQGTQQYSLILGDMAI